MNRRTLALALTTLLATTPACLFGMEPTGQQNNPNTNNATNNANNTNNTSVTGGPNNTTPTNNSNNTANNTSGSNNLIGSACNVETDEIPCDGEAECCGDTCVDTFVDAANCGGCGFECGEGLECQQGMCVSGDGECTSAETLVSSTGQDVAAFPRPLLIPVEDPNFACFTLGGGCPLSPEYVFPPIEDAAYLAFYGTRAQLDGAATTLNVTMVDERGGPLTNSFGTISNPGFELSGLRAVSVSNTAQVAALWKEDSGLDRKSQLSLYDLPAFSPEFPGTSLGLSSQPTVTLPNSERVTSFDVIQLPLGDEVPGFTDVRAVVFGIIENPVDLDAEGMFRLMFTVLGRRNGVLEQLDYPGTQQPYVIMSERVPVGTRAQNATVQLAFGESVVGFEDDDMAKPITQGSVFVSISGPANMLNARGQRVFTYNNFLLPTDEEFEMEGMPEIRRVYDTFRPFDSGWTPEPSRYPSESFMPVTLLQGEGGVGGVGFVSALTTSSDPTVNGATTAITITPLAADALRDMHQLGPNERVFTRPAYTFSANVEIAPWFDVPGVLGWLEGAVTNGVVGSARELRFTPVLLDEDEGSTTLDEQKVLVDLESSQWVEAYDMAVGARSYGVLMVTKLGAGQPSQARFRAISSDGRPICTLED